MEEPGYPGARLAFMSAGAELLAALLDGEGMMVPEDKQLRRPPHVAYVTLSHQYPLGMTMTAGRRMSMLKWAWTTDSWIIEDDYDSEFLPAFNDSAQSSAKQRQKRNSSR